MAPSRREETRRLMKEHHISFEGPIENISRKDRPVHLENTIRAIYELGKAEFDEYYESVRADGNERPWRRQIAKLTIDVVRATKNCLEEQLNESDWRTRLETLILTRLKAEVSCPLCRGRLWRSEQEAALDDTTEHFAEALRERQQRRKPCQCSLESRKAEIHDPGSNPLFNTRQDAAIQYGSPVRGELPTRKSRPYLILGLQRTKKFEHLLLHTRDRRLSKSGMIGDNIRSNPLRESGQPILFPFLVLEAKSEKGPGSFTDIQLQTAFVIRELLTLQEDLREAAGVEDASEAGPLVWFLANKGELWRVSAAFIQVEEGIKHYRVVRLWEGSVDSRNSALQLLLIVDFIFDWARDVYRDSIMRNLNSLAGRDTRRLTHDSDILSSVDRMEWLSSSRSEGDQVRASQQSALREDDGAEEPYVPVFGSDAFDSPGTRTPIDTVPGISDSSSQGDAMIKDLDDFQTVWKHLRPVNHQHLTDRLMGLEPQHDWDRAKRRADTSDFSGFSGDESDGGRPVTDSKRSKREPNPACTMDYEEPARLMDTEF